MRFFNFTSLIGFFSVVLFSCSTKQKAAMRTETSNYAYSNQLKETADLNTNTSSMYMGGDKYKSSVDDLTSITENEQRLIIYNASLHLTVKKRDSLLQKMEKIAKFHGGYISSFSDNRMVLKVRNDRLNSALADFHLLGTVENQSINAEDVTTAYRDIEIALDNSEKARIRYLQLFEQAKSVSEMIVIEKELERINGQIERCKAQLNNYNQRIEHAEIMIYVRDKMKPGIIGYIGIGLYKSVKWLFVR